ncbi:S41 family peptidase [Paenibacillus sp. J2TS4]|uniref:S41 family peptidase n=1 Tax=Paenibacillus sp. J2TS4 TaxID=2807194 RepID=UPI001B25B01E|nr:S41 family peptidase [Paenibacillus sp. J2TS4]GIP32575.1 hypothetical protein J2TS4_17850 [Paenibacillus sp. J2TS4]
MNKLTYRWKALILAVVLTFMVSLPVYAAEDEDQMLLDANQFRVLEVIQLLEKLHVSGVDTKKLSEASIEGMIEALDDPYTNFMTAEQWNSFQNTIDQQYTGLGIVITKEDHGVKIDRIIAGSPAEAVGLLAGDYVMAVNGQSTKDKSLDEVVALIPKKESDEVELSIRRGEEIKQIKASVHKVTLPVVTSELLDGGVGYIGLSMFSSESASEFAQVMDKWKDEPIQALIIDLRDNPGGLLTSAVGIAKHFIKDGVLLYTVDSSGEKEEVKVSHGSEVGYPVVLLVNEDSASASEILTAGLRDHGKAAAIVGAKTFGKGSVQASYELSDGSYLKITIEEYLTPKSDKVNGVGITPDIEVEGAIPQLLAALKATGVQAITINQAEGKPVVINGTEFAGQVPVLREEGKTFVHSRILASLAGGTIQWNSEQQSVDMKIGEQAVSFALGTDMRMKEDVTYIELDAFKPFVTGLQWSDTDGQLTLSLSGK